MKSDSKKLTPEAELQSYIDRLDPKNQKLFSSVRAALRKQFPTANELGYDYGSHVVIAYTATDSAPGAILSIAGRAEGVQLYFTGGPKLPDPNKLLLGSGSVVRFVWLESAKQLADPDVKAFIGASLGLAKVPFPSKGKGVLIIRPTTAGKRSKQKSKK